LKRVVLDTGVIISAALKKDGTSRKVFIKVVNSCKPLIAIPTLEELEEVMSRPKFARFIFTEDKISILESLVQHGELIDVISNIKLCRDEDDDIFLSLAIDGKADVLVSRDPDLLILKSIESIPILTPVEFLDWLK